MTPLEIEILMHYHARAGDHPRLVGNESSPEFDSWHAALNKFLINDYLVDRTQELHPTRESPRYQATEKLHFYCRCLCNLPEPIQQWTIPANKNDGCEHE